MFLSTPSQEFDEAERYWHLDRLYQDLASYKDSNTPLTKREKQLLRGRLLGYSPKSMAYVMKGQTNSDTIRNALTTHLYPLLKGLIVQQTGQEVEPGECRTLFLLEMLGYRKALMVKESEAA
jgi:hypothetical protein